MLKNIVSSALALSVLVGCTSDTLIEKNTQPAQIYHNGHIIPMTTAAPSEVEAVVENKGNIVYVGDLAQAKSKFSNANYVDLKGKTLLPSFIDPHSHFGMVSNNGAG